ncbi:MAG TPA: hypothetical protein ENN55_01930, partial [Firmicutes bacterium]|nr:hypothetical protein [Bacillota bacterium]
MSVDKRIEGYIGDVPGRIYVLGGDDDFFFREFVNVLIEKVFKGNPDYSAVGSYDFSKKAGDAETDSVSLDEVFEFILTQSMFSDAKIAVLNEIYKLNKENLDKLHGFIKKGLPDDVFLVMTTTGSLSAPRKKLLAEAGIKNKSIIDFGSAGSGGVKQWAAGYAAENKKTIDSDVLDYVISESNDDAGTVKNELDKLILMAGAGTEITKEDFSRVKGVDHKYDIWALTNAVLNKEDRKAFAVLNAIYDFTAPEMILGSIYSSFRRSYRLIYYV